MAEVVVGDDPEAVPTARRYASDAVRDIAPDLSDDVELVVAELVTNALLHGASPVRLRIGTHADRVRVEVADSGRGVPVVGRSSATAMTGRGLALVGALTAGWGVDPIPGDGKVVWAELSTTPTDATSIDADIDVDALLAAWEEESAGPELYAVRLGAVPTNLLLDAKAHIDNVVRELTLARAGETAGGTALPDEMRPLVATVVDDFAIARNEIKRQALAAAARGDANTELTLNLPVTAAAAGERYLAALDEADRYARAARLLTMAPPRSHREFRRWYVQSLVDQLRAAAGGAEPIPPAPFTAALASEVDRLASLEDAWDRLQLLQRITGQLTDASSVDEIAATVVGNAATYLGVDTARVYLFTEQEDALRAVASHVGDSVARPLPYDEFSIHDDLPGAVVARTGEPVFLRNLAQITERFPLIASFYQTERSLHVAPLAVGDHRLGVLSLTFSGGPTMEEETQVAFVQALADALAQALERAMALDRAQIANERLSFLADASVALSASLDFEATVDAVTRLMVPRLADWCVVQLLRDGALQNLSLLHSDPAKVEWAKQMEGKYPVDMDAPTGAPNVIRTGRSEIYPYIPEEMIEAGATDEEHLQLLKGLGLSSALVVPLTGRSGTFGAVTLIYAESGRQYDEADLSFVEDVARRAALALETAETFREQSGRLALVTRVAEAAQRAILAPPPARLGPIALAARYESAAAEALVGGDLYEVVPLDKCVRVLVGDVRGKGLAAVRTATIVLGEFRAAAADLGDLSAVAEQIDRRLRNHLDDEDFVTAVVAELAHDGTFTVANCAHPPPLSVIGGVVREVETTPCLPLGLGAKPELVTGRLSAGDRLFLYTDGVLEARDSRNRFVDFAEVVRPIADGELEAVLDQVLVALHRETGPALGDDLALLVAEYRP